MLTFCALQVSVANEFIPFGPVAIVSPPLITIIVVDVARSVSTLKKTKFIAAKKPKISTKKAYLKRISRGVRLTDQFYLQIKLALSGQAVRAGLNSARSGDAFL